MKLFKKIFGKYINKIKEKYLGSDDEILLYLCSGEALPETLSTEEEKVYIDNSQLIQSSKLVTKDNSRIYIRYILF